MQDTILNVGGCYVFKHIIHMFLFKTEVVFNY